jgi:hypothetical protein
VETLSSALWLDANLGNVFAPLTRFPALVWPSQALDLDT